jgi:DNA-binding transcriptional MerR regulator
MPYTISEVAKKMNISASTLRFYDKEGLLPFVERSSGGIRMFKDSDFGWIKLITCLKDTDMPIKDIKAFVNWFMEGDSTLKKRRDMFYERKESVEAQIAALQKTLNMINYKCRLYDTAVDAGTLDMKPDDIPEEIQKLKEQAFA